MTENIATIFKALLIVFLLTVTACQEIHIPEVSEEDKAARMAEFEAVLNEDGTVNGDAVNGKLIYTQTCKACHGDDGKDENFGTREAPSFMGNSAVTDPIAFFEITNFGNLERKMLGYYDTYGLTDLIDVVAYSQTLPE